MISLSLDDLSSPLVLLFLAIPCIYFVVIAYQHRRYADEPPVLFSPIPFLGSALKFGASPLEFLLTSAKTLNNNTFVASIAGERMVFLTDPADWNDVLRAPPASLRFDVIGLDVMISAFNLTKPKASITQLGVGGQETHKQFVTYLQKKEHLDQLAQRAKSYLHDSLQTSSSTASAATLPLFETLSPIIFKATMCALFGADHALTNDAAHDLFVAFDEKFPFLAGGAPLSLFPPAKKALYAMASTLEPKVMSPHASGLMRARHDYYSTLALTDAERSFSNLPMVWAAAANTIPAATWTLLYILRSPEAVRAVERECSEFAGDGDVTRLDDMKVLHSCVMETLRVTSSSLVVRRVEDTGFRMKSGTQLRGGDRVALFPPIQHFSESVFSDAGSWKHDRFLGEGGKEREKKVMPFGGGISRCPGRFFALREVKAFVCAVFTVWKMELVDEKGSLPAQDESRVGLGINQVKPGCDVMVRVKERTKRN